MAARNMPVNRYAHDREPDGHSLHYGQDNNGCQDANHLACQFGKFLFANQLITSPFLAYSIFQDEFFAISQEPTGNLTSMIFLNLQPF